MSRLQRIWRQLRPAPPTTPPVAGLTAGALTLIEGPSGSGKTARAWRVATKAAAAGPVFFIDGDGDGPQAQHDQLWYMAPIHAAQATDAAVAFCRMGRGGAIVLDSFSGLLPERFDAQRFCTRDLPRIIGAAYAGKVALLITHNPLLGPSPRELSTYAVTHRKLRRKP